MNHPPCSFALPRRRVSKVLSSRRHCAPRRHHAPRSVVAALVLALAGCASVDTYRAPPVDIGSPPPVAAQPVVIAPAANGAIYQAAAYRPLFEDHRARLPGDSLTVTIVEKVSASQKSTSSVDKSGSLSGAITALPGIAPNSFGRAGIGGTAGNTFGGKGATESSNDFSGTITVLVTGVLPNGHLLIQGEKQIGVNANVDVLRFSGQVDPRAIQPGNSVPSAQIANVRVEHRSRGQQADAQVMGWLSRVFLSVMPI
jgi:flagellar L-ring protein precursor FlgH